MHKHNIRIPARQPGYELVLVCDVDRLVAGVAFVLGVVGGSGTLVGGSIHAADEVEVGVSGLLEGDPEFLTPAALGGLEGVSGRETDEPIR